MTLKTSILILLLGFGFLVCEAQVRSSLIEYDLVVKKFSQSEIKDLEYILDFYDSFICGNNLQNGESLKSCYIKYFKDLKATVKAQGSLHLKIPSEELSKLCLKLDLSTLNAIWGASTCMDISLKYSQKYVSFLGDLSNEAVRVENYYKGLIENNKITPQISSDILLNYQEYNIENPVIRLFVIVHYLTLNKAMGDHQ